MSSYKDTLSGHSQPEDPWYYESILFEKGYDRIAGVDEAGRGPLAGPVVAAACILPEDFPIEFIRDSKKLTHAKREQSFLHLMQTSGVVHAVGIVDAPSIDRLNIRKATLLAMRQAVESLSSSATYLLIDGRDRITGLDLSQQAIVKGDDLCLSIGAASIIAKVTRDRIMLHLHEQYPQYEFSAHKGYGTRRHMELIRQFGPSPVHRRSFAPIRPKGFVQTQLFNS